MQQVDCNKDLDEDLTWFKFKYFAFSEMLANADKDLSITLYAFLAASVYSK